MKHGPNTDVTMAIPIISREGREVSEGKLKDCLRRHLHRLHAISPSVFHPGSIRG
jgi:hypothetical protein